MDTCERRQSDVQEQVMADWTAGRSGSAALEEERAARLVARAARSHPKKAYLHRIASESSALGQTVSECGPPYATVACAKRPVCASRSHAQLPRGWNAGCDGPKLSHQAVRQRLHEYVRSKMERDEYLRGGRGCAAQSVPGSTMSTPCAFNMHVPQTSSNASSASAEREQMHLGAALLNAALGVGNVSIADANPQHWLAASLGLAELPPDCSQAAVAGGVCPSALSNAGDDFPLRKTSSEPNLKVKSLLRQKVIERRASPFSRRTVSGRTSTSTHVEAPTASTPQSGDALLCAVQQNAALLAQLALHVSPQPAQASPGPPPQFASLPNLAVPTWHASYPLLLALAAAQGEPAPLLSGAPSSGPASNVHTPLDNGVFALLAATQQRLAASRGADESGISSLSSSAEHSGPPHLALPLHPAEQELSQHGKIRRRHMRPLNRTNSSPLPLGFDVATLQHMLAQQRAAQAQQSPVTQSSGSPTPTATPAPSEQSRAALQLNLNVPTTAVRTPNVSVNVNVPVASNCNRRVDRTLLKQHLRQRVLHKFGGSLSVDSALPPSFVTDGAARGASANSNLQTPSSQGHSSAAPQTTLLNAAAAHAYRSRIESSDSVLSASTTTAATTPSTNADDSGVSISASVSNPSQLNSVALLGAAAVPQLAFDPVGSSPSTSPRASAVNSLDGSQTQQLLNQLVHIILPNTGNSSGVPTAINVAAALNMAAPPTSASRGRFLDIASAITNPAAFMKLPSPIQEERFGVHTIDAQVETGVGYDAQMLAHQCVCGSQRIHPEQPERIQCIYQRLLDAGLLQRCEAIKGRKARLEELELCHTAAYALIYGTSKQNRHKIDPLLFEQCPFELVSLPCGGYGVDSDTYFNEEHSAAAARTAVACVTDLALKIAQNELRNGFALVRPPGHHAESASAMGYCYFNSVAIAAKQVLQKTSVRRIAIIDWDIHHGNGTQQTFYGDRQVLYVSIHRHDNGHFFPGTGALTECGSDDGLGFTLNIPWCTTPSLLRSQMADGVRTDADSHMRSSNDREPPFTCEGEAQPMSDAEYLAAFRCVVLPVLAEFDPELIIVSCGFDAALGHPDPIGGYLLTPQCFGYLTRLLMRFAHGHLLLALEGGYNLPILADCSEYCMRALVGDSIDMINELEYKRRPNAAAVETIKAVVDTQQRYWPSLATVPLCDLLCSEYEFMHKQEFINYRIAEMTASLAANALSSNGASVSMTSPFVSSASAVPPSSLHRPLAEHMSD